jgi:hypothetical protein
MMSAHPPNSLEEEFQARSRRGHIEESELLESIQFYRKNTWSVWLTRFWLIVVFGLCLLNVLGEYVIPEQTQMMESDLLWLALLMIVMDPRFILCVGLVLAPISFLILFTINCMINEVDEDEDMVAVPVVEYHTVTSLNSEQRLAAQRYQSMIKDE